MSSAFETFYAVLAQICFAALGLWWVVVEFRHERWSAPERRAAAGAISGQFIAIGLIALVAVLSGEVKTIWRLGSSAGGLLGVAISIWALRATARVPGQRFITSLTLLLFLVLMALSLVFEPVFGFQPILLEALIDVTILGLSVWQAWQYMMEA